MKRLGMGAIGYLFMRYPTLKGVGPIEADNPDFAGFVIDGVSNAERRWPH